MRYNLLMANDLRVYVYTDSSPGGILLHFCAHFYNLSLLHKSCPNESALTHCSCVYGALRPPHRNCRTSESGWLEGAVEAFGGVCARVLG